ncbi:hypothetical protein [Mesorhizobium sp.]|uniref:hypothetical protein n=1 Tax=Mesorhizobium sp. TaxID=1871066 RepID=UPI0025EC89C8|nr:hypothetical protein [Mesorhizobium sp.]
MNDEHAYGAVADRRLVNQQSLMISYDFKLMMVVTLVAFPLVFLLRKPQKVAAGAPAVHID